MYRVTTAFCDLQDNNHLYSPGDAFPRNGVDVNGERIAYLAGNGNRLGVPVIAEVKEKARRKKSDKE